MITLAKHRGLLATLVRRDLAARYRGSALGFLWSLVDGERRAWHDIVSGTRLVRVGRGKT